MADDTLTDASIDWLDDWSSRGNNRSDALTHRVIVELRAARTRLAACDKLADDWQAQARNGLLPLTIFDAEDQLRAALGVDGD